MILDNFISIILVLIPVVLGVVWQASRISPVRLKIMGLAVVVFLAGGMVLMQSAFGMEPPVLLLTGAVLLSGFCSILGQGDKVEPANVSASILIVLGLGLGVLCHQGLVGRLFLIGLLGYVLTTFNRGKSNSIREKLVFPHLVVAVILAISSIFLGNPLSLFAGLFLAVTFLPLAPFHLPFVAVIENAKGTLSSFWIVLWLAIGLSELNGIHSLLTPEMLSGVSLLALASAVYASMACLGQPKSNLFVASATVAHVALVWGLLDVFSSFPEWGIPFGVAVALLMGGVILAFSFVRQRYGWNILGKLPGLASPMPRFGMVMVFLVSFAMFLPLFSTFSGLRFMETTATQGGGIAILLITFLVVWLGGGWYFSRMLHQTAFGKVRSDVPYTDLRKGEFFAVSALLIFAAYSGMIH